MDGLLKGLDNSVFTVATTDNIDFLQSHASVYVGNQYRSWHGTTVQIVQPQQRLMTTVVQPDFRMDICSLQPSTSITLTPPRVCPSSVSAQALTDIQLLRTRHRERTSPISSPSQHGHSPAYKRMRRARTYAEAVHIGEMVDSTSPNADPLHACARSGTISMGHLQYNHFLQSDKEVAALEELKTQLFNYMMHKSAMKPEHVLFSFKDHIAALKGESEPAVVQYLSIVDLHADSVEAMSEVDTMLYREYICTTGAQHLIVAGDAKTYLRLRELKHQYGSELDWLLPFVGDWHVLYNYQKVLMKVYFEAGLKHLAKASGFRAETLTSLGKASNFKRTHAFLMQVWEALYRHMFEQYESHIHSNGVAPVSEVLAAGTRERLLHCNKRCMEGKSFDEYVQATVATESECIELYSEFIAFVKEHASTNDTWKFWNDFVFHDCLAYVGLYLAIRGGMWELRMASLKEMCPLFTAFDRFNYLKILPKHFAEVMCMPENIRHCLVKGGFVCNIRGTKMRVVALDEAHEMLINKDIKASVVRPSKEYLNRIMYYYPVRCKVCKQLKEQLSLPNLQERVVSIFDSTPHAARCEENVVSILSKLCESRARCSAG